MERREFLRQAAVGAAGLMLSETDKEVVDSRLTQKVTCAFKGTALSDLCERLRGDTGVHLVAGPSVADEKVTLFCESMPLRDVMRQRTTILISHRISTVQAADQIIVMRDGGMVGFETNCHSFEAMRGGNWRGHRARSTFR